jgi:hypothetical protein
MNAKSEEKRQLKRYGGSNIYNYILLKKYDQNKINDKYI